MDQIYFITPFITWFVVGIIKFLINSLRTKSLAINLIGYGGMPSNHSAIVSSMATLILLKEGFHHPAFGLAITVAFIVILDANSLRRQIGKHAKAINQLEPSVQLRERMGHTIPEISAGIITGGGCAWFLYCFFN